MSAGLMAALGILIAGIVILALSKIQERRLHKHARH